MNSQQTKVHDQMTTQVNSTKHLEELTWLLKLFPLPTKKHQKSAPKLILQGLHHSDTKIRQRYNKKKNITDQYH